jgi:hypothetical protein
MSELTFNTKKVVLDVEKLKQYLGEKYIDVRELVEATIDEVYECKFSEKKNKINIKRKPSQKQMDASKSNLKKTSSKKRDSQTERIEDSQDKNEDSQTERIENSQDKNEDSQDNSGFLNSGFSVPMLDYNSIGETSQGGDNELCHKCSSLLQTISKEYDEEVKSVKDIEELLTISAFSNDVANTYEKYEKIIVELYEAQIEKIRAIQSNTSSEEKMEKVAALDAVFGKYGEVYEDIE